MRISLFSAVLFATCVVAHGQSGAAVSMSETEVKALVRDSVRFLDEKNDKTREYAYLVKNHRKQFDSNGKVILDESSTSQRTFEDGFTVTRAIEKNGKPLSDAEKKLNDEKIAKRLAELRAMPASEREALRRKNRQEDDWAKEVPEALKYRIVGEETLNGRRCWVLDAEPNPNYRPKNMQARVFEKMKGKFWIDKADRELVRGEAETFDTVSIGLGLLARVEKGTRFAMQRTKLPDGNWVQASQRLKFGARVMLVKWMSNEIETQMSDFRHKSQVTTAAVR